MTLTAGTDKFRSRASHTAMSVRLVNVPAMGAPAAEQLSLPDLDGATEISLRETTFVVVDLETTGGRMTGRDGKPADAITEIGAVKVRGGVVLGEFATLVDPQRSIPPQIVQLTGITTAMVCDAPTIAAVLPMFLEFAHGAVLVAHNARFDMGFLRAAAAQCGIRWARPQSAVHRPAGPPRADPRGGPQCAAGGAGPAVRRGQ